ncbi:pimeloyl-ACP methyl ester carboxylesterase [Sphingomonas vulcanisoli]|uniref:Pimeloyl-ACP methyl ester carboxylesterase n=1 Tax=Sphingomonas vulcanisoli TaxID=1658060 RepID=A0ABX0TSW4_9SPHN|nr:alpha/beta hydrolase [Sphingomonas vulcanisoli]NIJ08541.1 pimeloyl-ACP methyl ester carboxylesterase [Sphingomonas vulcanisoli]
MTIRRGFADIAPGVQVHYRTAGSGGARPLVILHPSPGSSKMMEPLIAAFGGTRAVFALDTLGNGDSSPPLEAHPDIAHFAGAHMAAIDALGLEKFDLYGTHTGATIAAEVALAWPERVRHLILDGVSNFTPEQRAEMLAHHAPPLTIAPDASHLLWAWNFVRDAYLFWPWYKRDAEHLRGSDVPTTDALHDKFVEVIKAARTFHLSYNAAIAYDMPERFGAITVPTLFTCARQDMLLAYFDELAALMPHAERYISPGLSGPGRDETLARFVAFLDDRPAL